MSPCSHLSRRLLPSSCFFLSVNSAVALFNHKMTPPLPPPLTSVTASRCQLRTHTLPLTCSGYLSSHMTHFSTHQPSASQRYSWNTQHNCMHGIAAHTQCMLGPHRIRILPKKIRPTRLWGPFLCKKWLHFAKASRSIWPTSNVNQLRSLHQCAATWSWISLNTS